MFSLLYGLWEYMFRKEEIHILILGLDKAGKTTLLEKLKSLYSDAPGLEPDKILPTVGLNVGRLEAYKAQLIFWDLGGQSGLRGIWDKYYGDSHAILYVIDAADPARFEEAKAALERALGSRELFGAPLLVMANKQDKQAAEPESAIKEHLGLGKVDTRPHKVQVSCAYTGEGVTEGISWLIEEVKRSPRALLLRKRAIGQ